MKLWLTVSFLIEISFQGERGVDSTVTGPPVSPHSEEESFHGGRSSDSVQNLLLSGSGWRRWERRSSRESRPSRRRCESKPEL